MLAGIDFGSKMAGTTVICYGVYPNQLNLLCSAKKQDADEFLKSILIQIKPEILTIDAPLSLPFVFTYPEKGNDYFYRSVDKEVKAMSPMFLGGLTARAMKFKHIAQKQDFSVVETYPALFVKQFKLEAFYTKKDSSNIEPFVKSLFHLFSVEITIDQLPTWHHVDALIAWISSYRIAHRNHLVFGDEEGEIWI